MAGPKAKIWFVVWPDGKVFEGTQTSVSQAHAIQAAIRTWLIPAMFPKLDMGSTSYGLTATVWKSMQEGGFKCYEIDVDATGVSY